MNKSHLANFTAFFLILVPFNDVGARLSPMDLSADPTKHSDVIFSCSYALCARDSPQPSVHIPPGPRSDYTATAQPAKRLCRVCLKLYRI
jgi:hypothetical protein